ncbi:hypothetical protein GCM10020229_11450 [Kitasatospora albolonga]|uniref:peptidase inhibitor family I36 protein n=1 Tax=Kitasatospora albolonga TaxID=68173 RepID=UPI0031F1C035
MRLRNLAVAGLLAVAAVGTGVGTAVASAPCTPNNACLYSDANYQGGKFDNFNRQPNWGQVTYNNGIQLYRGDYVATNVSSLDNWDLAQNIRVFYNSQYRGACFTVAAGGEVSNFAYVTLSDGTNANDRMNSHIFGGTCGNVYNF